MKPALFKPGDLILIRAKGNHNGRGRVWRVVEEDTNKTPVVDLEPAYKLQRESPAGYPWLSTRYAKQSDLTAVEDE